MNKGGSQAALDRGERGEGQAAAAGTLAGRGAVACSKSHWLMRAASARSRGVRVTATRGRFRRSTGAAERRRPLGDESRVRMAFIFRSGRDKLEVGLHKSGGMPPL
jgi:hypothetical protein